MTSMYTVWIDIFSIFQIEKKSQLSTIIITSQLNDKLKEQAAWRQKAIIYEK